MSDDRLHNENNKNPNLGEDAEKSSDKTAGFVISRINHEKMNEAKFQIALIRKLRNP